MSFWDTSAIAPLLTEELLSETLLELFRSHHEPMTVWWGTPVECNSAISRLRRMAIINESKAEEAEELLDEISGEWEEVLPSEGLRNEAVNLLKKYRLKAADALQLAAALIWANHKPRGKSFVCLDDRLREAASIEGFDLFPEKLLD